MVRVIVILAPLIIFAIVNDRPFKFCTEIRTGITRKFIQGMPLSGRYVTRPFFLNFNTHLIISAARDDRAFKFYAEFQTEEWAT